MLYIKCISFHLDVKPEQEHHILLSYKEDDQYLKLLKDWSYKQFHIEISKKFPILKNVSITKIVHSIYLFFISL